MKKALKIAGIGFLGIIALLLIGFGVAYFKTESVRNAKIQVAVQPITLPTDPVSIAEGKRLVTYKGCMECHGADLGSKPFIDVPVLGRISGANLTSGKGSRTAQYKSEDWVRSIRYGIDPTGRPLMGMPTPDFTGLSNDDLGKIIAYIKQLPPVDREPKPARIGPLGYILYATGKLPDLFGFKLVDLHAQPIERIAPEPTARYGKYIAQTCIGCHGEGLSGGKVPGLPPEWPAPANLTPSGRVAKWDLATFRKVVQQGLTPDGHQIDPQYMPWKGFQAMTDVEIEALYRYVQQVPARAPGSR